MKSIRSNVLLLLCTLALPSCMMPKNHSVVMHGKVKGGDVPLYLTGSLDTFLNAGLILPDLGGYVRAEWDVMDINSDGRLSPSKDDGLDPLAQIAIPRLVSSFRLDDGLEIRRAETAEFEDPPTPQSERYAMSEPSKPITPSIENPTSALSRPISEYSLFGNSYFNVAAVP